MSKPKKYSLLFLIVLLGYSTTYGQDWHSIDSLKNRNLVEKDSVQIVNNYYEIAICFQYSDIDSLLKYSHKGLLLSERIKDSNSTAKLHYIIALSYYRIGQYKVSLEHINTAIPLFVSIGDSLSLMDSYNDIGTLLSYGNDQLASLEYHLKSLSIAEEINDTLGLSNSYNNLGYLYQRIEEHEKAVVYYKKTLALDILADDTSNISLSYANLGSVYLKIGQKEKAKRNYSSSLKLLPFIVDPYGICDVYLSASEFYLDLGKLDTAVFLLDKCQLICDLNDFPQIQANVYANRGRFFLKREMYSQSLFWIDKSIDLFVAKDITELLPELYSYKASALAQLNESKRAYEALCLSNSFKDSLRYSSLAVMISKYEKEQEADKELKRRQLEQALINQKIESSSIKIKFKFQIALLASILLVIISIVIIVFFFIFRRNNKELKDKNSLIQDQKYLLEDNLETLTANEIKLKQLVATKDKFFSILAHDLRSPFNSILGFSTIIIEKVKAKDYDELENYSSIIHQASHKTTDLIDNLIEWSRSQSNRIKFTPEDLEVETLMSDSVALMRYPAQQKAIIISVIIADNVSVYADEYMIKTVLRNLISNAIKFTHQGGKVVVAVENRPKACCISISDNGVGMRNDTLDKLFKVEENVSTAGTQKESGTGLGLILCDDFVKKHKGKIQVESKLGVGSTFNVILPLRGF